MGDEGPGKVLGKVGQGYTPDLSLRPGLHGRWGPVLLRRLHCLQGTSHFLTKSVPLEVPLPPHPLTPPHDAPARHFIGFLVPRHMTWFLGSIVCQEPHFTGCWARVCELGWPWATWVDVSLPAYLPVPGCQHCEIRSLCYRKVPPCSAPLRRKYLPVGGMPGFL